MEEVITTMLKRSGIKQKLHSLYLPQSSRQGEHMNRTIKGELGTLVSSNGKD